MKVYPRITGALCANSHPGSYTGQDAYNDMLIVIERNELWSTGQARESPNLYGGVASNLMARDYKDGRDLIQEEKTMGYDSENYTNGRKYVLRRLTPLECLRLQGLPDWWVDDVQGSDSAVYKMAGNGLAIPCACDVLGRIAEEIRSE